MNSTMHLNDDQIDDVLIGDAGSDVTSHLAGCNGCRERVATAGAPLASFAAVTLAWSERQSATMGVQPLKANTTTGGHRWSLAMAAAVLLVAGLVLPTATRDAHRGNTLAARDAAPAAVASSVEAPVVHASPVMEQHASVRAVALHASSAEVAQDNRMLEAIHDDLDASVQSPADAFGLADSVSRSGGGHEENAPLPSLD